MYLSAAAQATTWPETVMTLGLTFLALLAVGGAFATYHEFRKLKVATAQEDSMRQLVSRYEQLAEKTLDAQQRTATDISELRTRTAAVEQILRTVE